MLFKFNVNGVVITSSFTDAHGSDTTTVKIDNISLEQEVKSEELNDVITAVNTIVKELTTAKKNTNTSKRYHVCKYNNAGYWNCKRFSMYYIVQDRTSKNLYLKYIFDDADSLTRELPLEKLSVYNKKKYIVAEYDCNNFKL